MKYTLGGSQATSRKFTTIRYINKIIKIIVVKLKYSTLEFQSVSL